MLRISWIAKKSNKTVLFTRSLIDGIHKRQATFFDHVMRREQLEHLVTAGTIEGKHSRGNQHETTLDELIKRLNVGQVLDALKAT